MSNLFLFLWTVILLLLGTRWIPGTSLGKNFTIPWTRFVTSPTEMVYQSQRNSHFRVYARNAPPGFEIIGDPKTQKVKIKGMAVDFVEYVAEHLNLTLEFVLENQTELEKNSSFQLAANALINKQVDLVMNGWIPSPERQKIFDLTPPLIYDDYRIMVKWPEEMDRWTEVARPFDSVTWLMVAVTLLSMIGMTALLALVIYGRCNRELVTETAGQKIVYIIGIVVNQGSSETTHRLSLRILLGCWLLMMVVIINGYTSTLTSHMTVPKWKPIPKSLKELAEMNHEYQVTIMDNYLLTNQFLNGSSGTFKILGDSLRKNPKFLFRKYSQATDIVLKQKGANVETAMVVAFRIDMDYKIHRNCRMTASSPINHIQSLSGALPKDSPFTKIVEIEMQRAREMGINTVWRKNHVPNIDKCMLENQNKDRKPKQITLAHLSSAFAILLVGITLALFAFVCEIFSSWLKKVNVQQ